MLYKYLPRVYAESFLSRGEVLFRTLSYFRAVEHEARGDEAEGVHIDAPDNDVTLTTNTGIRSVGRFRYLRSIEQERVFAFCCSTELDVNLFSAFGADACVIIRDVDWFFARCAAAVSVPLPLDPPGLIHGPVTYFEPNRATSADITNPRVIPFLKHVDFEGQKEYRAVFARRGGFVMTERITRPGFTFAAEIASARRFTRLVRLGDLRQIVDLVTPDDLLAA
jgi:hypothetical protein